ncbi:MAG: exodeoxyribonuclease III [Alphaproteobacteria bacterium]|nr:MAG: exodeoxyribonuclease III [Alphaproteobacteria bacterium]
MRIATWNINSVRLRAPSLLRLMEEADLDVICLQETKTPDEHFPLDTIKEAGYEHIHFNGMKSYNGVAIISRIPFDNPQIYNRVGKQDCRHISVRFPDFELHNIYIPAGGDEPDRTVNEKFGHKLDFIEEMSTFFEENYTKDSPLMVVGDFNIAPREHDVWSHKQLLKVVSHTPIEIEHLGKMQSSLDWTDTSRHFVPDEEKCYTWWSYRNRDWKKSNRGRRLDHIWVTPPLKSKLSDHDILTHIRDWEKPSDHVPLIVTLKQ